MPSKLRFRRLVAAILLLPVAGCTTARTAAPSATTLAIPRPTEHLLDEDAESKNKAARREWVESLHKAAPGVDWREIEEDNKIDEWQRRNLIGTGRLMVDLAGTWTEVGSQNLAGRMHCGYIGPDGTTLYGGSDKGGVWRATLDGDGWTPLGDNLFGTSNEVLVLPGELPGESDVILVATNGGGIHVSRDDGLTWEQPAGLGSVSWIRGVALLDDAQRTILLYARSSASNWRAAVHASVDYGRTFSPRWEASSNWEGYMWVPRVGAEAADTVYIAHLGQLRRCTDGGFDCPVVGTIASGVTKAVLTGSEAGAPRLYAAAKINGAWDLYRSDDAGTSWSFASGLSDFWESLCGSIHYPDVLIYGGVEAHRSVNAGASFAIINGWADYYGNPEFRLHADIFGLYCWPDPIDPGSEIWYICTDGGLYRSTTVGAGVQNLSMSGLGISQYYSTHTASDDPTMLIAGSQDQGYQRGFVQPSTGPGPSTPLTQLISGDYGHLTSKDRLHDIVYSTYPGFTLIQTGALNPALHTAGFPDGSAHSWLPPVVAHPLDANECFFCGDLLYRYVRSGNNWNPVVHSAYDFLVDGGSYLSAMATAPSEPTRAYAVTDAGKLFFSSDLGVNWTESRDTAPSPHYFYGNTIDVNPNDAMEVAVGGSGYSTAGVVRSVDGGQNFFAEAVGLPATMIYDIAYAANTGDIYAATEAGAYRWDRATGLWENIMSNVAPLTTYWSVESVDGGRIIRFGTYGRGIWDFMPIFVVTPLAEAGSPCEVDANCPALSVCLSGRCYVPKNRYISIDPNPDNAGVDTARRVSLDLNGDGAFDPAVDAALGWVGEPIEVAVSGFETSPQLLSRIDTLPHFRDWSVDNTGLPWVVETVHVGDCEVSPGYTYLIQAIVSGQNEGDEANYSPPLVLHTVADFGDVTGSTLSQPPDGHRNFKDISAEVRGFQSIQTEPKVWLDLLGGTATPEIPDFADINFADINAAVSGFQGSDYPFAAPCDCPEQACP